MTIRRRVQEESPLATCDPEQHQCRCQDNDNDHDLQGRRSIRVASFDRHCLRLRRNADAFESIANITIELECLGYNELHEEILADAKLKTGYCKSLIMVVLIVSSLFARTLTKQVCLFHSTR